MILRPVLWLGLAYITGELLKLFELWASSAASGLLLINYKAAGPDIYGSEGAAAAVPLVVYLVFQCFAVLMFTGRLPMKRYKKSVCFLVLPVFLLVGYLRLDQAFYQAVVSDQRFETVTQVEGTVTAFEEKANTYNLYIKGHEKVLGVVSKKSRAGCFLNELKESPEGFLLEVRGEGQAFCVPVNEGMFNEWLYYHGRGMDGRLWVEDIRIVSDQISPWQKGIQWLRKLVKDNCGKWLSEQSAGVAVGMLLGDKSMLDPDLKVLYQDAGISHILAISGLHISFVGGGLYGFLRRIRLPGKKFVPVWLCMAASMGIVIFYCVLTGSPPSAVRAVVMTGLSLGAKAFGYTYDRPSAIALSALVILTAEPMMLTQSSFLLSFCAVAILAIFDPLIQAVSAKSRCLGRLFSGAAVTAGMSPVIAMTFYEVPMYSLMLNLLVIPLVGVVYPAMMICGLLGGLLGWIGRPVYLLIEGILALYRLLCSVTASLPGAMIITGAPDLGRILAVYGLMAGCLLFLKKREWYLGGINAVALTAAVSVWGLLLLPVTVKHPVLTMMDTGQGDCFIVQMPDGVNILFDGGSSDVKNVGAYRLLPLLKSRGIRSLDFVFVSHTDKDHISGIEELLKDGTVGVSCIVFPDSASPDEAWQDLAQKAQEHGCRCFAIHEGVNLTWGSMEILCLSPEKKREKDDRNNGSQVLMLWTGDFSVLFTGDISAEMDMRVMAAMDRYGIDGCQILKVAHHGAKSSTSGCFLDRVKPQIALISCGEGNSYGHPHKELLKRLSDRDIPALATFRWGEVRIQKRQGRLEIKTARP